MTNKQRQKLKDAIREVREKYYQLIANEIKARPDKTYRQIATEFGVSEQTAYTVARLNGLSRNNESQSLVDAPTSIENGGTDGNQLKRERSDVANDSTL